MVSQLSKADIIYPESDGKPMADNTKQFEIIVSLKKGLDWLYINDPQVFIAGDLLWYPVEGQPKIAAAPDTMVVFGRPKGDRGSYKQWEEENIPPQVVFEILSPGNTSVEMAKKLLFYDRYGVEEYYIYNPDTNNLEIWMRGGSSLDSVAESHNWVSPRLGVRFDLSTDELQIFRPDGTRFYSYIEINQMLEQERQRAEQATQQLAQMEAILKQYRDRFGELPE
ncbi:Uma2 family endonuclease [Pseudanabaena sp. PCC 6802]|uniref:Uma2 family endonuclease n=1 Tax=Pseudanabaena sp. PCC 6802 TaxID=118173 RepID=UPI000349B7B5|nr:Uma2 family endonuclease [Pseudanabaena sp. PCC 6802]